MTAIGGVFSDFKIIRTRSVCQLIIEIPIEKADPTLKALGGVPQPSKERWVGIVALTGDPGLQEPPTSEEDPFAEDDGCPNDLVPGEKSKVTPFSELSPSTQSVLKCNDPDFRRWMKVSQPEDCAIAIRAHCRVITRADLNTNPDAAARWKNLLGQYEDHRLGRR